MHYIFSNIRALALSILLCYAIGAFSQTRTHQVEKGETLYRISIQHGTNVEQLLRLNPGITPETLQEGQKIVLPDANNTNSNALQVAVVLPLESTGLEGIRSVEFYRGILMAANALCEKGQAIDIHTYSEYSTQQSFEQILLSLQNQKPQLIFGPVYPDHFPLLAQFAKENNVPLYIPFSSKVSELQSNPFVHLINTPEQYENILLAHILNSLFPDYRFAFLHHTSASASGLANELKLLLRSEKKVFTEFNADAPISQMYSATSKVKATIVVPDSSTPADIKNTIEMMNKFHASYPQRAVALIGLFDWEEALANIDTSLLFAADFFLPCTSMYNAADGQTKQFEALYKQTFNKDLLPVTPKMALLGYDFGMKLLGTPLHANAYSEMQNKVLFNSVADGGGKVLNSIFMLHYRPDNKLERITPQKEIKL